MSNNIANKAILSKANEMVKLTTFAWMERQEMEEKGLSQIASAACWCSCVPGTCGDCQDMESLNPFVQTGKINIGSGEDANAHR